MENVSSPLIMEICKAPTLRLKTLNKHTHIMYIEMENVIKKLSTRVFKHCARDTHTHTHTHTHTLYRLMGVKDSVALGRGLCSWFAKSDNPDRTAKQSAAGYSRQQH